MGCNGSFFLLQPFLKLTMKKLLFIGVLFLVSLATVKSQEKEPDTTMVISMEEVIVIGKKQEISKKENKALATLDEYLEKSAKINMVKRGAYAWEPMINGMTTERSVVTIDGMRIFGACTDKMDPVTSYVEISNLSEASIKSGQGGAEYGATIGGGIDLKRQKEGYTKQGWNLNVNTGGESNGDLFIAGTEIGYGDDSFYFNSDFTYRDAANYFAGGDEEVQYSQYTKYNFSAIGGKKLSKHQTLEASVIFDKATDVGYPALPMDVSLAQAFIGSVMYEYHQPTDLVEHWETKLYFNTIFHEMDDSARPDVPVRMDMPGWSDTYGFYSKANVDFGNHRAKVNLSSYYNRSLAEMTMYPNDPSEKEMFMLTWPDVRTLYNGIFLQDNVLLSDKLSVDLSGSIGSHYNSIENSSGMQSLQIFYPEMEKNSHRLLTGINSNFRVNWKSMNFSLGAGYGERAPSVSEAYGFYLYNSFDNFDYIGNPELSDERSFEVNAGTELEGKRWTIGLQGSYFHIEDYIIGITRSDLGPMTIGANGVKVYEQLPYATLINTSLRLSYDLSSNLFWNASLLYSYGRDDENKVLPLVQPFTYNSSVRYLKGLFSIEASLQGSARKSDYSEETGESETPAYALMNISASHTFYLNQQRMVLKLGAENLFDSYYTTFSDWNNIPRKGRNVFINVLFSIL